jgi:Na+/H+ antiporter NhaD/arsenite permease-like protein
MGTPFLSRRYTPFPLALLAFFLIASLWLFTRVRPEFTVYAETSGLAGRIIDEYDQPVSEANVSLYLNGDSTPTAHTETQSDGSYLLVLPTSDIKSLRVVIERPHFVPAATELSEKQISALSAHQSVVLPLIRLSRQFEASFWVATLAFIGMLAIIATEKLHNTLAALLTVAVIMSISLIGGTFSPALFIFDFEQALYHVDFEVVFLLMGMMIVIGVIEETGIFQWMALQAYKLSRGKVWLLTVILMSIAAASSALLDNVTTMLLVTPITLEIALVIGINPLVLILPTLLAANMGGLSTLIGTPVNIMIGSFANLSFNDFISNLTGGILIALIGLGIYILWRYRHEHRSEGKKLSKTLLTRLEQNGRIKDPVKLRKAGGVFVCLLALFIFGEQFHLTPAVSAIIGAVAMLLWVHPHIEEMMGVVDWTTLIFFIGLFITAGALEEVGLLALIASTINSLVNGNLLVALLVLTWGATLVSGFVDNIPFTAAMLPVVRFLSTTIPGADNNILYFALAVGAGFGGSSSLIGDSANLVVAGILERAGYKLTFRKFFEVGAPVVILNVSLGLLWLIFHFGVLK